MKSFIFNSLRNFSGPKWPNRIVVFESDDWGSIRMPSAKAFEALDQAGVNVRSVCYDSLDSLESEQDLEALFQTLSPFRDDRGTPPVFTFNTVVGNPCFEKIKAANFEAYFWEGFEATYERYFGKSLLPVLKQGQVASLVVPQFHAREHVNVSLWMNALRSGHRETQVAFDHKYFGLCTSLPSPYQPHYLSAFHTKGAEDVKEKSAILFEGLKEFQRVFHFRSKSFVPCNYIFPAELEKDAKEYGVELFQGQRAQLSPQPGTGRLVKISHFSGQKNAHDQIYSVRNCHFEPSVDSSRDWVNSCLMEISNAFLFGKPAIISTHRVNFVGSLKPKNRHRNNLLLRNLLRQILTRWPDTWFMSTDQLLKYFKEHQSD